MAFRKGYIFAESRTPAAKPDETSIGGMLFMDGVKQDIYEVVLKYCRGVDRADMSLVRAAYHEDAMEHHTGFDGTIDDYVGWLEQTIPRYDGMMHIVSNHLSAIDGNRAVAETYGMGVHWMNDRTDPLNFTSGFRQIDRMEKRSGRWAIAERWVVREWSRSDAHRFMPLGDGPRGVRGQEDLIYKSLEWLNS
ncbi:nuclear transport factor 2 family protein [Arthrobacter sp. FW306-2-2C-D06B]|uniref:nuclear transport factor 2 family protein n=1 Tax=Arthrobacter sp. FW306-2-2C-D06B TaxID=2879618 RepID=UPI001F15C3FE|nr:nuclear transport factor 2 family protein [Arthrobacter sp. FW306-2-2C-D06B]UKA60499.1 nuclear transport factor 2 family protein [Arthrobacter sp. FW306-2-2C-D06B]